MLEVTLHSRTQTAQRRRLGHRVATGGTARVHILHASLLLSSAISPTHSVAVSNPDAAMTLAGLGALREATQQQQRAVSDPDPAVHPLPVAGDSGGLNPECPQHAGHVALPGE